MKFSFFKEKITRIVITFLSMYIVLAFPFYIYSPNMQIVPVANAATLDELQQQRDAIQKKLDDITKNITATNNSIAAAKAQKSSTENQIKLLSLQIDQQQLVIDQTEATIEQKQNDIAILEDQITTLKKTLDNLDVAINQKKQIADKRLQNIYKVTISETTLDVILNATSAEDFLAKIKYQRLLRGKDEEILASLNTDRVNYDNQKTDLESKKAEVQTLTDSIVAEKADLVKAQNALDIQRSDQQTKLASLSSTVGFQQSLYNSLTAQQQQLENQVYAIQQQLFEQFRQVSSGRFIHKGDFIGIMGCTGYCTGPHLHFFASYNSSASINPCALLPSGVYSGCGVSNALMSWPMRSPFVLSRGFTTAHQAIDIVGTGDKSVYAAHDGWVTYGDESSCAIWKFNPTAYYYCQKNGPAHYAVLCENKDDCNKGLKTGYWHLQR